MTTPVKIDEAYVHRAVETLKELGFPASEGYFLILIGQNEADELKQSIRERLVAPSQAYQHGPAALFDTMTRIGATYVCTLGDAVVAISK